jgi:PAS domain S-box-containing protein
MSAPLAVQMQGKTQLPAEADAVKLLLVDDDRDNLLALQAILEPLGQELMLAASGTDALRLCLDHDFAAILLDVRMPEMDGFETAEMIRLRKRSKHTPILFLTAYRSDEQLFRGYDLGAVDFLFKPIVPEVLQSKVNVFVGLSRSEGLLRRQAEELTRSERRFRAVLEAAPDAMLITAEDGMVQLVNSRVEGLFKYPREALIGTNIRALIPEWQSPSGGGAEVGLSLPIPGLRLTGVRHDSSQFPADITRSVFQTSDGVLVTSAVRDATDLVAAETRIHRINLELEQRVTERTADLTFSNEALRQFAWAASHDLQEPIRTVLAYSQWLAQITAGSLGPRAAQMLEIIERHAISLNQLMAALRQYIHVSESGQQDWIEVDVSETVVSAQQVLQKMIEETGAEVECGELPKIPCIEILLVQLFQNLIGNAIKYRSSAPPRVYVSAESAETGWVFSVKDNGIGIDPKYFDYIFGVFRRLKGAQQSGTGIGLAICKAAVERLGGRIWVESELGSGSVFRFLLPRVPRDEKRTSTNLSR